MNKLVEINIAEFHPEKVETMYDPMTLELRNRFQLHLNITVSGSSVSGVSVPPDGSEMVHQVVKSIRALDGNDLKERLVASLVNGITKDL